LLSSRKFADAADAELATFLYAKTAVTTLRSATRLRSSLERRALCSSPASGVSLYLWL